MVKGELTRLLDMVKERRQGENIDWALVGTLWSRPIKYQCQNSNSCAGEIIEIYFHRHQTEILVVAPNEILVLWCKTFKVTYKMY